METKNRHALVTGGTSGIGYELAKLFALEGYNLILVARNRETLEASAAEMQELNPHIHVHVIATDLFKDGAAQEIYDTTSSMGITVDVLVNDAGQGEYGEFAKTDLARELDIIHLNVVSLVSLTKFYLRDMLMRNDGKILQLASSISKVPSPLLSVYAATKAFVLSFTEALIEEIKDTNVSVTALQPNATDTDFFHKARAENSKIYRDGSMYSPEEVAKAGFDGLMKGESIVLPGLKNKFQEAMNTITPDSVIAKNMAEQNKPSESTKGRTGSAHKASARSRVTINKVHGDY